MKNLRQWLTVDEIGGMFAVVRREQWEKANSEAIVSLVRNSVLADGPFADRPEAERAKYLLESRCPRAKYQI